MRGIYLRYESNGTEKLTLIQNRGMIKCSIDGRDWACYEYRENGKVRRLSEEEVEEIKHMLDRFEKDFERMSKDFERMMSEFERVYREFERIFGWCRGKR
ncbi:MAG TPA: hypothetical protein ENG66_06670 [Thermococcus sp.]|nr:hypothetical protein [Thermococcus sp.]